MNTRKFLRSEKERVIGSEMSEFTEALAMLWDQLLIENESTQ